MKRTKRVVMDSLSAPNAPEAKARHALRLMVFMICILAAGGAFAQKAGSKPSSKRTAPAKSAAPSEPSSSLSLDDYLGQVSEKHSGYKAADRSARGAKLTSNEASLLFKPNLTGNASTTTLGQGNPFGADNKLHINQYKLGVTQQTNFGLSGALTYNRAEYDIPASQPIESDWFQLELSQSLWRNWAGRETRGQSDAIEAGALANSFAQTFATKQILLEAESNYWNLALTRERVAMQKDAVDRAQRIQDWTSRRVRLQLADRAEGLQAAANLQAARLALRSAEDAERAAAQAFNSSRGVDNNVVDAKLTQLTPSLIASMDVPERTNSRDDVKAAELQAKAASANAQISQERNKPTVEIFASVPVTEPTGSASNANASQSSLLLQGSTPTTTIGLRLSAPLDFSTLKRVREGYAASAAAADLNYQRKAFEEQRDWSDLTAKFQQAKERFKLYTELEKSQKEKLDYERNRQQRGRSTLQQVLLFEQDYEQAQIGRIATLAELLGLNAQMKLYGVSYESR